MKLDNFALISVCKNIHAHQVTKTTTKSQWHLMFMSSHLYLYSAFNNTNCNKALHNIKIVA